MLLISGCSRELRQCDRVLQRHRRLHRALRQQLPHGGGRHAQQALQAVRLSHPEVRRVQGRDYRRLVHGGLGPASEEW